MQRQRTATNNDLTGYIVADGRMLKKTIAGSEKLSRVNDKAKVLWFMMLPHTDIEGRLKVCPQIVKGQYLTMLNYTKNAIQKALVDLHNADLITLYEVDGKQFAEYRRFKDFQSLRYDREGQSTIPPPENGVTPGVVQEDSPIRKLSKVKLSKVKEDVEFIFKHWNLQKQKGPWKTHARITPDIHSAVENNLRDWSCEDIKSAITNFAMILQEKDYLWTYAGWGLREFLSRHERDNRKALQWWRFHPNNFRESDWLTEDVKKARNKQRKDYTESILNAEPEKIREAYRENKMNMNWLIRELRPEIAWEIQNEPALQTG